MYHCNKFGFINYFDNYITLYLFCFVIHVFFSPLSFGSIGIGRWAEGSRYNQGQKPAPRACPASPCTVIPGTHVPGSRFTPRLQVLTRLLLPPLATRGRCFPRVRWSPGADTGFPPSIFVLTRAGNGTSWQFFSYSYSLLPQVPLFPSPIHSLFKNKQTNKQKTLLWKISKCSKVYEPPGSHEPTSTVLFHLHPTWGTF